jgi:hemerythrin-like metal-binding protein
MHEEYPPIGLAEIDRDHEAIACDLRRLLLAVEDDDRTLAVPLAEALNERARAHFALEEQLMREIGFIFCDRHKCTHDAFLEKAFRHIEDLRAHGLTAPSLRWMAEIMEWFPSHVLTEDLSLGRALAGRRAR